MASKAVEFRAEDIQNTSASYALASVGIVAAAQICRALHRHGIMQSADIEPIRMALLAAMQPHLDLSTKHRKHLRSFDARFRKMCP